MNDDLSIYFNPNTPNAAPVSFADSVAGMYGIFGSPGELGLDSGPHDGVQQANPAVLIRTDQKGGLRPDMAITVGGTPYVVRYLIPEPPPSDGRCTLVFLR